ncbi:Transposase IS200 like protein [Poriferisphaera corsica]|uniref:Transposase IS200 like protein n=1 Tax=Poriferisphaera corsica TaxID=2528020 RepID=A0A517YQE2_9BACT|nr:transposase [Poriferisphaera corsica]QDU32442.1 Transposase IS200 like protein [Poriferisphaera corsica]
MIECYFVWVTRYHKKVLVGELETRMRELVCEVCSIIEIGILSDNACAEHVRVLLLYPLNVLLSKAMPYIEGVWLKLTSAVSAADV